MESLREIQPPQQQPHIWRSMMNENNQPQQPQQQAQNLNSGGEGTTILRTCFNGVNTLCGVGILSVPYAIAQGGWLSLILLLLVGLISWYTGLLLKRCMKDPIIKTYSDIGHAAFRPKGRTLIAAAMYLELFAVAVEFFILEGDTLNMLFPNTTFTIGHLKVKGKVGFIIIIALIVLPSTWLRNLGVLAYFSIGGIVTSIILLGCVLWVGAIDGVGFHARDKLLDLGGLPLTASIFMFCYGGHAVFPTLCTSMKNRTQFPNVLAACFITSTIIYGSMATIGYLMFGEFSKDQITLNLPLRNVCTKIAISTIIINLLTKFALILSPISLAIEAKFIPPNNRLLSILVRTLLMISIVVVALAFPYFGYVMAFIGAILNVTVSLLLPCVCYLKINEVAWAFEFEFMAIIGILVSGILIGITGTYISVKHIIAHL
ncbi:amino acid transporter AVT1I-like [Ziziphus jujuba]|uniref:Amino acid transporter AVT1I-like n=1 Tax=Ziziphus jujuba TaxID=326968 RepID=A0ABM3ZYV4_ZIZJJ|nr:amino acid transporter AVT1I-like [Ziziphus jujuba]